MTQIEKYTMLIDWKNQYCYHATQSNLQIQCNHYQNTNYIFHRTRINSSKICMETQKTMDSRGILEKEEQSWKYHTL